MEPPVLSDTLVPSHPLHSGHTLTHTETKTHKIKLTPCVFLARLHVLSEHILATLFVMMFYNLSLISKL